MTCFNGMGSAPSLRLVSLGNDFSHGPAKEDLDRALQKSSTDFVVAHFYPDAPVLIKHNPDPRLPLIVCVDPSLTYELSTKQHIEIRKNTRYPKFITVSLDGNIEVHCENNSVIYSLFRFEIEQALASVTLISDHIPHVPDPPYCVSTTTSSISVQWSLPEPPGISRKVEIQYRVLHIPGNRHGKGIDWQYLITKKYDSGDFFCTSLEGLSPGTHVQFRLAYWSMFGKSVYSEASDIMMSLPSAPSPPSSPICVTLLSTCALLRWHPPNNNGADISGYRLRGRSAGAEDFTVLYTGSRVEFLVLYLFPEFSYSFEVCAFNHYGSSPYSQRLSLITPRLPRRQLQSSSLPDTELDIQRLSEERADVWLECFDQQLRREFYFNRLSGARQLETPPVLTRPPSAELDEERQREVEEKHRVASIRQKRQALLAALRTLPQRSSGDPEVFALSVRREHLLMDGFMGLSSASSADMRKKLRIDFFGEAGIDSGGLLREFYQLLSQEAIKYAASSRRLLKEDTYGRIYFTQDLLDKQCRSADTTNDHRQEKSLSLKAMQHIGNAELAGFIGLLAAKAFCDECMLDFTISVPLVKHILGESVELDDIEAVDSVMHKSLSWILENDITGIIDETFAVMDPTTDTMVDLCASGSSISVTEANKREYVSLRVAWLLKFSVHDVLQPFLSGFWSLIPAEILNQCNISANDLFTMMEGANDISVDKIRPYCVFQGNPDFNDKHEAIINLWCVLRNFSSDELEKFLLFVTACGRIPLDGFNPPFNITQGVDMPLNSLPKAHTCFNQLVIPEYSDPHILREKLIFAFENCSGFHLA